MTTRQLTTYLPFWEKMKKRLSKTIERKEDLAEVQSILNRAYMKALKVGFEEGAKNMYSEQDMEAFAEWTSKCKWFYDDDGKWYNEEAKWIDNEPVGFTTVKLREIWEKERGEATE